MIPEELLKSVREKMTKGEIPVDIAYVMGYLCGIANDRLELSCFLIHMLLDDEDAEEDVDDGECLGCGKPVQGDENVCPECYAEWEKSLKEDEEVGT